MENNLFNKIEIMEGDLTAIAADAIVNAANSSLLGGGGVDGAIHRAAGPELLEACRKLKGCPTGEARITKGFNLPARYVIHTVGPVYSGKQDDPLKLASCYRNSLLLAEENALGTVAFPAISCGVYGYPIEKASKIALETVLDGLRETATLEKVMFVLFSKNHYNIYEDSFSRIKKDK